MNGSIIWGETLVTCFVECEYQPPHIFAPAAGLNGIIYIIFNRPAVYFSSGVSEFFLFSLAQGHSARRVPRCPLTSLWLLACYEATRACVSRGCSPQRCFITVESIWVVGSRCSLNFSIQFVTLGSQYQSAFSEFHSCSCQ